jgi:hypothetical protein
MALPAPQVNVVGFGYEHYCYGDDKSATLYLPHNSSKMLAQPDTNIHGAKIANLPKWSLWMFW